ncbi:Hypothetical protein CINCED_3A004805 [Cinara cedri]|uniref:Radial spoke 3 n=1 Tax=Cinara cedri TaxID=506608 RepID=A0A5E4MIM0_9HEMI|nr:Hypothetical protein CINCED_3A004805 [Cinara cedri]
MREDGTTEESSSSSFMVIGNGGGDGGSGDDDDRGRQHFVKSLDSRLKKLQRRAAGGGKRTSSRKPVFVTTVKTGIFLDPPPDLAALLGLEDRSSSAAAGDVDSSCRYYSYSSKPRVLYDKQHQRTTVARKYDRQPDTCKQMGYTNIMHDRRVVRGSNFTKKTIPNVQKESAASREAESRRLAMARKKAMDYQTRALRLHLGTTKDIKGHHNVDVHTDLQLEELIEYREFQSFQAQTEFDQESFSNPGKRKYTGTDASTQVDDKDLHDFETEVTPIAESLIASVFRQAMREVLYEDELDARARQQRALSLQRTIEKIEMERLQYEDESLNKVITDHAQLHENNENIEKARRALIVVNSDTTMNTADATIVESPELVSWIKERLHIKNDDNLRDIIEDLIRHRLGVHNEITKVQDIQKPEELFREIESVTLLQNSDSQLEKADSQLQKGNSHHQKVDN